MERIVDLRRYGELCNDLIAALRQLAALPVAAEVRFTYGDGEGPTVREFCASATEELFSKPFTVAVVGAFNTGKSSLLNVLLEQLVQDGRGLAGVLPEAVLPTTSVVTVIRYSEELTSELVLRDGRREPIDRNDLQACLCDEKVWKHRCKQANIKKVKSLLTDGLKEVHIGVPSRLLQRNVQIVDTPGLGSVNAEHGRLTRHYLAQCDAALFLVSTDPPMGEREMTFLQYAAGILDKFLFVQTKRDLGERYERDELVWQRVLKEHQERIGEVMGVRNVEIHAVSALQAARGLRMRTREYNESGVPSLRDKLERFLAGHSGMDRLWIWLRRAVLAHDRVSQHLARERQRLEARLKESSLSAPAPEDMVEWGRLRAKLEEVLVAIDLYLSRSTPADPPDVLARVAGGPSAVRRMPDAKRDAYDGVLRDVEAVIDSYRSGQAIDDNRLARIERQVVRSVQRRVETACRPVVDMAFEASTRAAQLAIPADRRPAVAAYLTYSDLTTSAEMIGQSLQGFSLTKAVEERHEKGGFWAGVGRAFLGWLFPNIGTEMVVVQQLDPEALRRVARHATETACATIENDARQKLAAFRRHVLDEMDAAEAQARKERAELVELQHRSRAECEADVSAIQEQQERLTAIREALKSLKALVVEAKGA